MEPTYKTIIDGKYYYGECLVCKIPIRKQGAIRCKSHALKGNTRGFKKGLIPWNKDKPFPQVTGDKNANWGKFGSAHPHWTGRTILTKAIRACVPYQRWRFAIFQKDNFTCRKCKKRGGYLQADHHPVGFAIILRKYKITTIEQALNCKPLWNARGRTMCAKCHPRPGRLPIPTR